MTERIESSRRADLADIARLVANEAGALVAAGYRSRPVAEEKAPRDLVTEFDRASEALLVSRLGALAPGIAVVGEESTRDAVRGRPGLVWYVDPLDGTTNFVHGHPFWCVSVGLVLDDEPLVGAVVAPVLGLEWAGHGDIATRNGSPCRVSATDRLDFSMVATGFPAARNDPPNDNFDSFIAVKRRVQAVRRCGSAAIDLCFVADGTYDAYWERRLKTWDVVGGGAIVRAAGGRVTALDGSAPDWHSGTVVASNGRIHDELVRTIASPTAG